jgi:hypothetical protein
MAKQPPEIRDRFRIYVETTMEQMGSVVATLTKMGVENIGHELITDVKAWGRKEHDTTAAEAIAEYVQEHPTFHISELVAHFKQAGRSRGAVDAAVRNMVAKNLLTKLGDGNYQSADVKAIAPPKAAAPVATKKARPANKVPHYDISNKDLIWRHIKNRVRFKLADLRVLFRANNRPDKSVSPLMTKMVGEKLIRLVGPGEYLVMKKVIKATAKKKFAVKRGKHQSPIEPPAGDGSATSGMTING